MTSCSSTNLKTGLKIIANEALPLLYFSLKCIFQIIGGLLLGEVFISFVALNATGFTYGVNIDSKTFPSIVAWQSILDVSTAGWLLVGVDVLLGICAFFALACHLGAAQKSNSVGWQ